MNSHITNSGSDVFVDLKNCFERIGLMVSGEFINEDAMGFGSKIQKRNGLYQIGITYIPEGNFVELCVILPNRSPKEKIKSVLKLISLINQRIDDRMFMIHEEHGVVAIKCEIDIRDRNLNHDEFYMALKTMIKDSLFYFPVILQRMIGNEKPKRLLARYLKENERRWFFSREVRKSKKQPAMKSLKTELQKEKYPFIVEVDDLKGWPPYPTHTHGLKDIGWPEFFVDPICLGKKGNALLIASSFNYFKKPENTKKLDAIINGEILEVSESELFPEVKDADAEVFCYRKLAHDFEGLRRIYTMDDFQSLEPDLVIIQIWIKGDDYVLTDGYYMEGVLW